MKGDFSNKDLLLLDYWNMLVSKKIWILFLFLLIAGGIIYYQLILNEKPLKYKGTVMLEIGTVKSDNPNQTYLDNAKNLENLIEYIYDVDVILPKDSKKLGYMTNTVILSIKNEDKELIKEKLMKIMDFIIQRHKSKSMLYDKFLMTRQVGDIRISNQPINLPNKLLVFSAASVLSLLLSILIITIVEYIKKIRI